MRKLKLEFLNQRATSNTLDRMACAINGLPQHVSIATCFSAFDHSDVHGKLVFLSEISVTTEHRFYFLVRNAMVRAGFRLLHP